MATDIISLFMSLAAITSIVGVYVKVRLERAQQHTNLVEDVRSHNERLEKRIDVLEAQAAQYRKIIEGLERRLE